MKTQKQAPQQPGIRVSLAELIKLRYQCDNLLRPGKQQVATHLSGGLMSRFRGRGIDFAEVRNYQPGDEIRNMDWRVTARTGRPHTKLFEEERERPTFLMVDFGPSMFFGTRNMFKSVLAARSAALLAWSTARQNDRVGGIIFNGNQLKELPAKSQQMGVLPLLKTMVNTQQPDPLSNPTIFAQALSRMRRQARPGSLVILISDFSQLDQKAEQHLGQLAQQTQLLCLQVRDPLEIEPPRPGRYAISDGVAQFVMNTHDSKLCQQYRQHFAQRQQYLQSMFHKNRIRHLELSTNRSDISQQLREQLLSDRGNS